MSETDYVLGKVQEAFKAAFDVDPRQVTMDTSASDIPLWDSVGHLISCQQPGRGFRDQSGRGRADGDGERAGDRASHHSQAG